MPFEIPEMVVVVIVAMLVVKLHSEFTATAPEDPLDGNPSNEPAIPVYWRPLEQRTEAERNQKIRDAFRLELLNGDLPDAVHIWNLASRRQFSVVQVMRQSDPRLDRIANTVKAIILVACEGSRTRRDTYEYYQMSEW